MTSYSGPAQLRRTLYVRLWSIRDARPIHAVAARTTAASTQPEAMKITSVPPKLEDSSRRAWYRQHCGGTERPQPRPAVMLGSWISSNRPSWCACTVRIDAGETSDPVAAGLGPAAMAWAKRVSEGGLEPPCPFGALAPQASASAYSATRTWSPASAGPAYTIPTPDPGWCRPPVHRFRGGR